jgi:hypothetical protein
MANPRTARALVVPLLAAALGLIAAGCGEADEGLWATGQILQMRVSDVQHVESVAYQIGDEHFEIRPQAQGLDLVVAKVLLVNRRSAQVSLFIDADAVDLEGDNALDYPPLDPYVRGQNIDAGGADESLFTPFLWDTVELARDFQIVGWMLFEVPRGLDVSRIRWHSVDTLSVILDGP